MAEQPVNAPDPRARIIQRCPNCEARADVSTFVAGALVRCARCGVRFQVMRPATAAAPAARKTPPPPVAVAPVQQLPWAVPAPQAVKPPLWPDASEPRWDELGLGAPAGMQFDDAKTLPSDALGKHQHAQPPRPVNAPPTLRAVENLRPPVAAPKPPSVKVPLVAAARPMLDIAPPRPPAAAKPLAPAIAPPQGPTAIANKPPAPPPAPLPLLDGFSVYERLGQGGMGEVFRCSRRDGRAVAVKVLSQSLAVVPDYVKRFEREAAAMAQLDHPGIVRLLERGRSGMHCWISMELIDGVSLRTYAHQNRPSSRMLARLLSQVAHALAYAHARGVVHRDLKPDNVLVQADLKTKVLDFGLAGLYIQGAECLTQSNVAMGTANYMAPEQRKDAKHVDHRADLYSFGVMLYELLTGELPIGRFPAPSKSVPGLSADWDHLVERCLELDPQKRPHSALELAHALEKLAGLSPAMDLAPRTKRKAAGRSGVWSWIGLGAIVMVLGGVVSLKVVHEHDVPKLSVPALQLQGRAAVHPTRR